MKAFSVTALSLVLRGAQGFAFLLPNPTSAILDAVVQGVIELIDVAEAVDAPGRRKLELVVSAARAFVDEAGDPIPGWSQLDEELRDRLVHSLSNLVVDIDKAARTEKASTVQVLKLIESVREVSDATLTVAGQLVRITAPADRPAAPRTRGVLRVRFPADTRLEGITGGIARASALVLKSADDEIEDNDDDNNDDDNNDDNTNDNS